jgi:hydroxyacid-oxoacid transhydrogenase
LRVGNGVTAEVGFDLQNLGAKKTMVLTDDGVSWTPAFAAVVESLKSAGQTFDVFNRVRVEPTDTSMFAVETKIVQYHWMTGMIDAIEAARTGGFDSFVAVGGGSTIDTAKAAALYASNRDADFLDFVVPPFGKGLTPSKPMLPLIAIPTTSGTGSETTGVAIFDYEDKGCKSAIRHRCIKPLLALIDPQNVKTLPRHVAIYSGFDVLCHALESYTAKSFDQRSPRPANPSQRPLYQGSNPISDVWAREALQVRVDTDFSRMVDSLIRQNENML